ncbi:MAG: outer membrane beta-barrel protein [Candidatus Eisenbacteria bacterium]|uniref:Outer membrane beta-barrel protein n=1 Tax=Eiseniibacteriota bacterium TaxID=2212470 RepID=A0A849SG93_UNCEI|nr:outer membrane beta-barrel protein [Candidatus Eisenbacteria bacterium]
MRKSLGTVFAVLLLSGAVPAMAATRIVLPRAGQVGIGVQGGYGTLLKAGDAGEEFGSGAAYSVRLRYRMRYERGIGLSFENNRFAVLEEKPFTGAFDSIAPERLDVFLTGFDFYQMFNTRSRNVSMLSLGAGLASQRVHLNDGETELSGDFSGDALYLSAGAGIERFSYGSIAIDLSTRYYAMFKDGKAAHNVQVALGLIFYAGY